MRRSLVGPIIALLIAPVSTIRAQSFDVPSFQTPFAETGLGVYAFYPRAEDVGFVAAWRQSRDRLTLGLRGGFLGVAEDDAFLAGAEIKTGGKRGSHDGSAVAFVSGMGVGWIPDRDFVQVRFPLGFTWGSRRSIGGLAVLPYLHPRAVFDVELEKEAAGGPDVDDQWNEDASLHFNIDLGFDVEFNRSVKLRFATTLGHDDAVGFGFSLGTF